MAGRIVGRHAVMGAIQDAEAHAEAPRAVVPQGRTAERGWVAKAIERYQRMPKINVAAVLLRKGSGYPPPSALPVQPVRVAAWAMRAALATSAST